MDDIVKKIQDYEDKVDRHKEKRSKLQGKLEVADQQLKDLGFDSVEEAEAHITSEQDRLSKLEDELLADIKDFEEEYAEYLQD